MLELKKLSFTYPGGECVLRDVELSLPTGCNLALVGENGSGKSTLLKLIAGVLPSSPGAVRVDGERVERGRNALGYVGQSLLYDRSFPIIVGEVVSDGLFGLRLRRREARARVRQSLSMLGMDAMARRPFSCLSGGQRQRVLIARALVSEPSVLLLDEPTAGLDAAASSALLEVLERLGQGRSLVFATHRRQVLRRLADWRLLLPEQRVVRGRG